MRESPVHLTDTDLGAVLDPASGGAVRDAARAHAAGCLECDHAIHNAKASDAEVADLLHLLDHPAPSPDFAAVQRLAAHLDRGWEGGGRRATTLEPGRAPSDGRWTRQSRRSTISVALRRSAIILGLSAAAAAAAVPTSPLRQFLARLAGGHRPPNAVTGPSPANASPSTAPTSVVPVAPRGVSMLPPSPAGQVEVVFETGGPSSGVIHLRPMDGSSVAVRADGDGPVYTVGRGVITVDARGAPGVSYDVDLPAATAVADVSIRIGARVVFARHHATVSTQIPRQSDGTFLIPLAGD